ncbi:MAG: hypothetical protein K2W82_08595 [Candidatus Obscuribacterales bacterium]|nr:hypothetical protein [Candidatus Obscuribacterales bacterium]
MLVRLIFTTLLSISLLGFGQECLAAKAKTAVSPKKTVQKKKQSKRYSYGAYFVPPPPAYMPSILPELQVSARHGVAATQSQNPYKRYIYTPVGMNEPQPVQVRKGVVTWVSGKS